MTDLQFVPSDDMIKELQKRFDELVVLGSAQRTRQTEDLTVALIELGRIAIQAGGAPDDEEFTS